MKPSISAKVRGTISCYVIYFTGGIAQVSVSFVSDYLPSPIISRQVTRQYLQYLYVEKEELQNDGRREGKSKSPKVVMFRGYVPL